MIDHNSVYRIKGYDGIAWFIVGYDKKFVPDIIEYIDSDGTVYEDESHYDGEWQEDTESGILLACMLGDDRTFKFDISDFIKLDDDEYCSCCGQVGCKAYSY